MSLLRSVALRIPAIARLHAQRDALAAALGEANAQLATTLSLHAARPMITDYAYSPRARPLEASAGGRQLVARFTAEAPNMEALLARIARHLPDMLEIGRAETDARLPFWANDWLPPLDGVLLHGLIAEAAPRQYIEVGSGISTRFVRRAIDRLGLGTRIVSVDPQPRSDVEALCDESLRFPMEEVPRSFWDSIGPQDVLFLDNSHRSFMNSDVTVFFTEVLPGLPRGTLWGLHDILLPWDYPQEWAGRFCNEQYLLMAYLLGGAVQDDLVLAGRWASLQPQFEALFASLWARDDLVGGLGRHAGSFWMRRGGTI